MQKADYQARHNQAGDSEMEQQAGTWEAPA
jgi:hypothetical protein